VRKYALDHGLDFFDILKKRGFLRNLIIRNTSTGELMAVIQVGEEDPGLAGLLDFLRGEFPEITSLQYVINNKGNETFFDLPVKLHSGQAFITDQMGDLKFRIGPKSFYQTNGYQAHQMYQLVRRLAALSGNEIVYDLYSGAGTIALFLASAAQTVVGVEQVPEAMEDARINAGINGVENTHFYTGDTKDVIDNAILNLHGPPDVIITDPPRSGMHREVVERIVELAPSRVVYVSCNPATQARDVALMADSYHIKSVHPIDMFPHTAHVESVVLLERN
jgi:23S rRNA (uracil1939-C5)-methyltransferase